MGKLGFKLIQHVVKKGSKELDVSDPIVMDTFSFVIDVAKEIIKPW